MIYCFYIEAVLDFGFHVTIYANVMIEDNVLMKNQFKVEIKNSKNNQSMIITEEHCDITKDQKLLFKELQEMEQQKSEQINLAVDCKRKLADIPSLERQCTAALVQSQIEQHEGGKMLLDSMMENLDETVKMLGQG